MRIVAMVSLTLAMFVSSAATVSAAIVVYTDKTAWENALGGQFLTEDFADDQLNTGVSFVSTESGHINPAQENYQDVLTSTSQNEPMTTWSFTPEITAYGGDWTLGGPGGSGNSLQVYIADSFLLVGSIPNSYSGEFWGFISDSPFTSVILIGGGGTHQQHYSLDNMVYSSEVPTTDTDADGIVDHADNCILIPNGPLNLDAGGNSQLDTDGDGYGNLCDPDFDGNLTVDFADLAFLKSKFFTSDPDADLDGNGRVDFADLAILKSMFFSPPGPSGLAP